MSPECYRRLHRREIVRNGDFVLDSKNKRLVPATLVGARVGPKLTGKIHYRKIK